MAPETTRRIKVLAFMESQVLSGPAKNLLAFARLAVQPEEGWPAVDIAIATFHRPGAPMGFIEAVEKAGLKVIVIPEKRVLDFAILSKVRATLQAEAPDIVQTHNIKSHFLVKWLGVYRRYPWLAVHHGYTTTDARMRAYNQLDRYSLRSAHQVMTVCQAFAGEIAQRGVPPERITVQHNMVSVMNPRPEGDVKALRLALGLGDARILLCIGRFSREKGHPDLIRAAARLRREAPELEFRLVLVGDGPEHEALQRLTRELSMQEQIIFAGYQPDVTPYYAMTDVFVLPSHSEGSPNTLLEAMAAGVPSLATRVGGVPEIADHERNAWLVEKGNIAEMARGLRRLLVDSELRSKLIEGSRQVTDRYRPAAYRRRVVGLYQKLLGTSA